MNSFLLLCDMCSFVFCKKLEEAFRNYLIFMAHRILICWPTCRSLFQVGQEFGWHLSKADIAHWFSILITMHCIECRPVNSWLLSLNRSIFHHWKQWWNFHIVLDLIHKTDILSVYKRSFDAKMLDSIGVPLCDSCHKSCTIDMQISWLSIIPNVIVGL